MADELNKAVRFELVVKSGTSHDLNDSEKSVRKSSLAIHAPKTRSLSLPFYISLCCINDIYLILTQVLVRVTDQRNKFVCLWPAAKFVNRRYLMQELYQQCADGATPVVDQAKVCPWLSSLPPRFV